MRCAGAAATGAPAQCTHWFVARLCSSPGAHDNAASALPSFVSLVPSVAVVSSPAAAFGSISSSISNTAGTAPFFTMTNEPDPRRHAVLFSFCLTNFLQCFAFMDFSTVDSLVKKTLNTTDPGEIGLLYNGGFASTLPAMIVSLWLLLNGRHWTAGTAMSVLTVAGAWLRVAADSGYPNAQVSRGFFFAHSLEDGSFPKRPR